MSKLASIRGASGQVYRVRLVTERQDLPKAAGLFCFVRPERYRGAPLDAVYWGRASESILEEFEEDAAFDAARRVGISHIGYIVMPSRVARRKAIADILKAHPTPLNYEQPDDLNERGRVHSRWQRTTHRRQASA